MATPHELVISEVFDERLVEFFSIADEKIHEDKDHAATREAFKELSGIASDLAQYYDYLMNGETPDNKRGKFLLDYFSDWDFKPKK